MSIFNAPKFRKPGFKLALIATILSAVVVVLGAYTRLIDFGFGCSDWPSCYGQLSFFSDGVDGYGVGGLAIESGIWPELVHRYLAGILGLSIIVLAVGSWRRRDDDSYPFRLPTFILFLVVWQVLFGMWTVKLTLWPQVVTVHLLGGMVTLSLLWLLTLRLDNKRWKISAEIIDRLAQFKPWIVIAIVIVVFQILLGGWTSANYAAFACPDFPSCQNQWWPEMDLKNGFNITQAFGPSSLSEVLESEARVAIHFVHRLWALVATVYLLGLTILLLTVKHRRIRRMSIILAMVLLTQLLFVVISGQIRSSLITAIVHNIGAALLLLILVTLATRVWTAKLKYQRPMSGSGALK
jgi:heme a synthase